MEDLLEENKKLKERVKELELLLERQNGSNSRAYVAIRAMIVSKVEKLDFTKYDEWQRKRKKQQIERQVMRDLLWNIRVRRVTDLRTENIKQAEEFIKNYKFEEMS